MLLGGIVAIAISCLAANALIDPLWYFGGNVLPLTLAEADPWAAAVLVDEYDPGFKKHLFDDC